MLQTLRTSLGTMDPRSRRSFAALSVARIVIQVLEVVGLSAVGLLGTLLAGGLQDQREVTFLGQTILVQDRNTYLAVIVAIAAIFLLKTSLSLILMRASITLLVRVESKASREIIGGFFAIHYERLEKFSKSEIQWLTSSGISHAYTSLLSAWSALISETALLIFVLVAFIAVDGLSALAIALYFGLLILIFQYSIGSRLRQLGLKEQQNSVGFGNHLLSLIEMYLELRVYKATPPLVGAATEARVNVAEISGKQRFLSALPRFVIEASIMFGVLGLVWFQFTRSEASEGIVTIAVFLAGGLRMMAALLPIQNSLSQIRVSTPQAKLALEAIAELSSLQPEHPAEYRPQALFQGNDKETEAGPLPIELRKVSFAYDGRGMNLIRNVSLRIEAGESVALVGASGSGKSTLTRLMLGAIAPQKGSVFIGAESATAWLNNPKKNIGFLPQNPGLLPTTILENVTLTANTPPEDKEKAERLLDELGLNDAISRMPEGVLSTLGPQNTGLSHGESQRLALARALFFEAQALIVDEPTSALDAGSEQIIVEKLRQLQGKVTIVQIAHRLNTVEKVDRVFLLDSGRVLKEGSPEKVLPMILEKGIELE